MAIQTKYPVVTGSESSTITPRGLLADVSRSLQGVHGSLLSAVQLSFEKLHGRVPGPAALLQLVMEDPLFAWLRPLSAMVAELDSVVDDPTARVDMEVLDAVRNTIERQLGISGELDEFADSYRVYLQTDPSVVVAHADLRRTLNAVPRQ